MEEKNKKKQIIKISVFITSLFVIFLSVTYAFINQTLTGTKRQVITAGNLSLELQEDENNLTIENAMPMYDEVGMIQDAFTFRLINKTSQDTNYILKLESIVVENPLDPSIVKYGLTKDDEVKIDFVSSIVDNTVDTGVIKGNQTIEYSLRLWVDSNVENLDNIQQKRLSYKLNIEASQDVASVDEIEKEIGEISTIAFDEQNLGELCKTYNDGVDTFLVGQCQNNYVWWSGKLWRVVLKNNMTGAVKMITDNDVSGISYAPTMGYNNDFEKSYADQWLSQEFLPTLHNYENYIETDSEWDLTRDTDQSLTRPSKEVVVNRAVGLLNAYEYYTTYNASDNLATKMSVYLNNKTNWWLITYKENAYVYYASNHDSTSVFTNPSAATYGIRPVVNLKSNIQIVLGNGTQSNPYRLAGDKQETIKGTTLLNTRYSGEYVTFNNDLYRIVDTDNNLTKIVAVDQPNDLVASPFNNEVQISKFGEASIKTVLENYYQGLNVKNKNMIEPNTVWYIKTVDWATSYKMSICTLAPQAVNIKDCEKTTENVVANIGLPRYGEMFASQITRGTKSVAWMLTPYSEDYVNAIALSWNDEARTNPTNAHQIRPSMYLKSTVRIASNNTGNGTYEKPYSIELGA